MQERSEVYDFADRLIFSDKATFHVSGKVHQHNFRIWRTQNPHAIIEHVQDSPKVNVFSAISKMDCTVTGRPYLDMLENWLMPQINKDSDDYVFQQDGRLAHFNNDV